MLCIMCIYIYIYIYDIERDIERERERFYSSPCRSLFSEVLAGVPAGGGIRDGCLARVVL